MSFLLRWITPGRVIGLLLLIVGIFWLRNGLEILGGDSEKPESKILTDFKNAFPQVSDWITQQMDRYGTYEVAVAIQSSQPNRTLDPEALKKDLEIRTRLVSVYQNDAAQDESLLWSHGTALDVMVGVPGEADRYLTELEEAQDNADYWSLARNDPIALTSTILRTDEKARAFYKSNQDWFAHMLEVLMTRLETGPTSLDVGEAEVGVPQLIQLDDLLAVATEAHPYLLQMVPEPRQTPIEACIYFETFRQFGTAIVMAAGQGVPVREAAEVIILNRDAIVESVDEEAGAKIQDPTTLAARLVQLSRKRPSVWSAAQRDGYVLSFDSLVPGLSQSVLEEHPNLGVASLIVTQYPEVAVQATKIVHRYGELGVAVLVQYNGSERFIELLTDPNVDHRVAMLAAIESDTGLEAVAKNAAYLEKVIDEKGNPRKPDWWVNVPLVGGIANVARNYAKGYPSDWSEIGWAAWDVADIGLMVVSFGTSKIATTAAKQTAKGVGKKAATKLTTAGIRRAAPAAKNTAMRRMITALKQSKVAATLRWTVRTTIHVGAVVKTAGGRAVGAMKRVVGSIPPSVRKWVARGLLATSLFIRGPEQVAAMLKALATYAKEQAEEVVKAIPEAVAKAIDELKEMYRQGIGGGIQVFVYLFVLFVAFLIAFVLLLNLRPATALASIGYGGRGRSNRNRTGR